MYIHYSSMMCTCGIINFPYSSHLNDNKRRCTNDINSHQVQEVKEGLANKLGTAPQAREMPWLRQQKVMG